MKASALPTRITRAHALFIQGASYLSSPLLLVIRLYWGWQIFTDGQGKLTHLANVTDYFANNHILFPAVSAWLVGATECVGGLFLLTGLLSRLTTIPLIFTMTMAYFTVESDSLKAIFSDPDKFTGATPFLYLFAFLIVLVFGPGVFSLDWLIHWIIRKTSVPPSTTDSLREPARI